jgi:RNA-directed DNA polymerase
VTHSKPTTNPTGGAEPRREVTKPALDTPRMERVVAPANMQRAWRQVKANQGAPGIDRMTLEEGQDWLYAHGPTRCEAQGSGKCRGAHGGARTAEALLTGTYQPLPLRRKAIPKPGGRGQRLLGIRSPRMG